MLISHNISVSSLNGIFLYEQTIFLYFICIFIIIKLSSSLQRDAAASTLLCLLLHNTDIKSSKHNKETADNI